MTTGDLLGQLGDGPVEDGDVIGDGVGPGVARSQHPGERLPGGVGGENIGWKP